MGRERGLLLGELIVPTGPHSKWIFETCENSELESVLPDI